MKPLTTGERLLVNRAFWSVMVRGRVFDAYWVDTTRMVVVRQAVGRRCLPTPRGAIHFGRYDPCATYQGFVADLECLLAHQNAGVTPADDAPCVSALPHVCTPEHTTREAA